MAVCAAFTGRLECRWLPSSKVPGPADLMQETSLLQSSGPCRSVWVPGVGILLCPSGAAAAAHILRNLAVGEAATCTFVPASWCPALSSLFIISQPEYLRNTFFRICSPNVSILVVMGHRTHTTSPCELAQYCQLLLSGEIVNNFPSAVLNPEMLVSVSADPSKRHEVDLRRLECCA